MRRDQLNRRTHQTSAAAKAERPQSPQVIQRGKAVRASASADGGGLLAFCKIDAPDSDEISCYLRADLSAWSGETTYAIDAWVEVSGTEYKSLQADNIGHAVTDTDWWEEGTLSVTVRCLIHSGSSLTDAAPYLKDGEEIQVENIGDEWICDGFNGAKFT